VPYKSEMLRALTVTAALVTAAGMAAGCGSADWQASADKIGRDWGDSHPTIVRQQSVRLLSGTDAVIMELRGHFKGTPSFGPVVHLNTVVGAVDAHNLSPIESGNENTAPELAAFARARDARPMFRIFPEFSSPLVQCSIPSFGGHTVKGTCTTRVEGRRTETGPIRVALLEHWPIDGDSFRPYSGGWIVTVAPSGRILSVRRTGDLPPQLWTSANPLPPPARSPLAIRRARRQLRYLGDFSSFPGTRPCRIDAGGLRAQAMRGTCTTKLLPQHGTPPVLEFIEHWRQGKHEFTGGWIVTLSRKLKVLSVRITGSNPPQTWR
jgi:hypothetical protein